MEDASCPCVVPEVGEGVRVLGSCFPRAKK